MFTVKSSRLLRRLFFSGIRNETSPRMKASAIVFAPHQDDEVLGCAGTILLKSQAGTPVACVFMTDGRTSHRRFMEEGELRHLRQSEALDAAAILGIQRSDVHFLDFEDCCLNKFHTRAVEHVLALIHRYHPDEVYVPYQGDGNPDHEETYAIVVEACWKSALRLELCEYPIWFWNHWPWVSLQVQCNLTTFRDLLKLLKAGLGWRLFRAFRSGVYVGGVIERKRQALAQYRSQMTVFKEGTAWPTLPGVSNGEFLDCFFQKFEVFRCRTISAGS